MVSTPNGNLHQAKLGEVGFLAKKLLLKEMFHELTAKYRPHAKPATRAQTR